MKKIKLPSRYPDIVTEAEIIEDKRAIVTTNGNYVRVGTKPDEDLLDSKIIEFIDFEGGPIISVGDTFNLHKIKAIKSAYLIEFE